MRRISLFLSLLITSLVLTSTVSATPVLTPHRALYTLSLASAKNGSTITDVSGHMVFEIADACDGWAEQQHMKLHFTYAEGDESEVSSTEITWESKDGKRYNFNMRRVSDNKEIEAYNGKAVLNEKGSGTATYTVPKAKTVQLPVGTLFPTAHISVLMEKAGAGDLLFSRRVFDGSDEEGSSDVSAFIHPPESQLNESEKNSELKASPLLALADWSVRLAYFKPKTETGESDYETNINLLPNGVVRKMLIDYGDFSVIGILTNIEALPPSGC